MKTILLKNQGLLTQTTKDWETEIDTDAQRAGKELEMGATLVLSLYEQTCWFGLWVFMSRLQLV